MGATTMVRGGVTRFLPGFPRDSGCHSLVPQTSCLGDVEFEFLDDGDMMFATSSSSDEFQSNEMELDLDEDDDESVGSVVENKSFWDNQHQILQTNLYRTGSLESRLRNATKEAVRDIQQNTEMVCSCSTQITVRSTCRNCLLLQVSRRLQNAGYNSAICKTKWKTSPTIPSGEHTFLDVIDRTNKKQDVRVIIELNFRAEFEMAKASEEYNGVKM